ncbi:ABC transporter ATP-binding protein [Kordiimonas sp. SCSIO 12603]|uniref:ABC transporter ATP-binding protein n=1 Tax=Kordiimonas sp. SCSIO 12603 TaxID=2829596 RepID=UPI002104725E|nr:ABC transporter ATP-binding protein [Kordiimonas sp. SCSIO 12603]UTW58834.1 ABC transporter ATP-binding protein [Kordiimonas sp. SCSIO 12603]
MLKLGNLSRIYRTDEIETLALNNVNVEIADGEFLAIMGPSGCGKSTLLNLIGMLDSPSSGDYFFRGVNIAKYSEKQLSEIRKKNIGFIFQSFNLIDELTVAANIELALLYQNIPAGERRDHTEAIMEKFGIAHRANHMPSQLSGGQQQRVAVARAIVAGQKIILADEPTGNLDSVHGREVMEMLQSLNAEGTSIIMVTHSSNHAAFAHRTIKLFDGHIVT